MRDMRRAASAAAGAATAAALIVVAGLAFCAAACGRQAGPAGPAPAGGAPVTVRTVRVGGTEGGVTEVPGTVEALETAAIASRIAATVTAVPVEIGQEVRRGALLARLDDRDLGARAAAAEAGLVAATARLERLRGLLAKDAATRQEVEDAIAAEAAARAERDAARARDTDAELRAPFDGVVVDRRVRAGDLASPGRTLFVLQGRGRLRVTASVSRPQADALRVGQAISVTGDDGAAIAGRLSILSPASDPGSRRVPITVDLPPDPGLRAGSFVRLLLPAGGAEEPPLVPRAALVERGALTGVFVLEDGRARLRWFSAGERAGDAVEARAGLRPGEMIILDPAGLSDGAPVTPAAPGEAPSAAPAAPSAAPSAAGAAAAGAARP